MIYYLGGFGETCNSDASVYLQKSGVLCVPLKWDDSLKDIVNNNNLKNIGLDDDPVLIGFSMGALIVLEKVSNMENIKLLILCSITPFFKGYKNEIGSDVINLVGQNKINELMALDTDKYKKINIPVRFLVGSNEDLYVKERIEDMYNAWMSADKELIEIDQCRHNIHDSRYLLKIEGIIKSL